MAMHRRAEKSPVHAGLVCSKGTLTTATLFVAAVLLALTGRVALLRGRLLLAATAPTADRRLVGALVLLRRRLLLVRAALTAGRRLLTGTLILLRRRLLPARTALARGSTALRADHVRQSEPRNGLNVDAAASLETLLTLERDQRLSCPRAKLSVRLADIEPFLVQDNLHLADLLFR